jgi:hypothetical protein
MDKFTIKNLKIIIGEKIIKMIRSHPDINEFDCILDETDVVSDVVNNFSIINCKDTEERLSKTIKNIEEIRMKDNLELYLVNIKYCGMSFMIKANDEDNAKSKLISFIKFNSSTYKEYENITIENLVAIPFDKCISFIKNSDTQVSDISRFGY